MGSLADFAATEPPKKLSVRCTVARLLSELDDEDRATFLALIAEVRSGERSAASVGRILARAGHPTRTDNLTHHLRGDCRCADNEPLNP